MGDEFTLARFGLTGHPVEWGLDASRVVDRFAAMPLPPAYPDDDDEPLVMEVAPLHHNALDTSAVLNPATSPLDDFERWVIAPAHDTRTFEEWMAERGRPLPPPLRDLIGGYAGRQTLLGGVR